MYFCLEMNHEYCNYGMSFFVLSQAEIRKEVERQVGRKLPLFFSFSMQERPVITNQGVDCVVVVKGGVGVGGE